MSRHYHTSDCDHSGDALAGLDETLERIADTLDDYMEMSLAALEMTKLASAAGDPEMASYLQPLADAVASIKARRAAR